MPYKDPEKQREAHKIWREKNKEKCNERNKKWAQNNKEKVAESQRKWYETHKEQWKEYKKNYLKEYRQSPQGIKTRIISDWKRNGLIHDNYEELYEIYITTERCDVCKKHFSNTYDRCMDHDHETGFYRHILCRGCNTHDNWQNKVIQ